MKTYKLRAYMPDLSREKVDEIEITGDIGLRDVGWLIEQMRAGNHIIISPKE